MPVFLTESLACVQSLRKYVQFLLIPSAAFVDAWRTGVHTYLAYFIYSIHKSYTTTTTPHYPLPREAAAAEYICKIVKKRIVAAKSRSEA